MLSGFVRWSEPRASRVSLRSSLVSTIWAMLLGPALWVLLMPLFGSDADAVLYALVAAILLAAAGCFCTLSLLRRWSK